MLKKLEMDDFDVTKISNLIKNIPPEAYSFNICDKIKFAQELSFELPKKIYSFLKNFQFSIDDEFRLCLLSNLNIFEETPTPANIRNSNEFSQDDFILCSLAFILGEAFGWKEEQNGRIIHDIIPIKEHRDSQESTGSEKEIFWHTDEAFHDYSADYLLLFCIKNPGNVATNYCSINSLDLSDSRFDILFQRRFSFRKVSSHKSKSDNGNEYIKSVLYGSREKPFIRIDPFFMVANDQESAESLKLLIKYINSSLKRIILSPGDLLIIDNAMCVHGRNSFVPSFNGSDRWLKRINITRDLYKSQTLNGKFTSRVI